MIVNETLKSVGAVKVKWGEGILLNFLKYF